MDINEKLAVVTGAGSGIGRALASRLVDAGARFVVCTDLDGAAARETADLIGAKASGAVLDVADQAAIEDLVTRVEAAHGGIDIFVSNAGYALGGGLGLDTDQWRKMMEVHLWAHLNAARAVVPGMIARGGRLPAQYGVGRRSLNAARFGPLCGVQACRRCAGRVACHQLFRSRYRRLGVVSTGCAHQHPWQAFR
jgi:NAD(P)-dependent dehydrogenase (short-subunit alcohol dehydrogenase family)